MPQEIIRPTRLIDVLNDEMLPLQNQTYATLLNYWFQQVSEKLWESWGELIQLAEERGMMLSNIHPAENVTISRPGAFRKTLAK